MIRKTLRADMSGSMFGCLKTWCQRWLKMSDKDILAEAKDAYRLGLDAERDNRDSYIED